MKMILGTNRINYRTVESELLFQKISWLQFISRSKNKILWNINLDVLDTVSFFHQRKNRRTVNDIGSMFKVRVTKFFDTLTDIFDKFKKIKTCNSLVLYRNPVLFCVRFKDTFVFTFKMMPIFLKCNLTDRKTTLIENLSNVYFVAFWCW